MAANMLLGRYTGILQLALMRLSRYALLLARYVDRYSPVDAHAYYHVFWVAKSYSIAKYKFLKDRAVL